jgi:hypothetical protein
MNPKLPIVNSISYSALVDWHYCPHYYLLVNIKRLKPWKNTPDTIFGKILHQYCQDILSDKIDEATACAQYERKWKKFCSLFKLPDFLPLTESGKKIIENVKPVLLKHFGPFKVSVIERRISMQSGEKWPQKFKGFIDIVLEVNNGQKIIADFKTTGTAFFFNKYRDRFKDYQLILYKHFYCTEENISPDDVETYFFLLEKDVKSKNPVSVQRITSGNKKVENALLWLKTALSAINREIFIKNRSNCFKYGEDKACVFYNSEHCPK